MTITLTRLPAMRRGYERARGHSGGRSSPPASSAGMLSTRGYVLDTDKRVKVEECTVPGCENEAGRLVEKICYMHKSRLVKRGYAPDSPEFHAPPYRIGYRR